MKRYVITTQATVERIYEVEADNEKDAIARSVDLSPINESDVNEETLSVVESK